MENLDKTLAELCEKLGVGSESLVKWLVDGGLESYARLQMTSYLADGLIWLLVTCLIVILVIVLCRRNRGKKFYEIEEYVAVVVATGSVAGFILLFITLVAFENAFFWYTNPDGMFVKMLLETLG